MKFDVVVGNPPYQEESIGNSTQAPPIYHKFMDIAYDIADKVVLITPARFLFNAGATGKAWNKKMLNDEHLKVVYFEQDSSRIFPNTDIKGGVVVTYRSIDDKFGLIGTFTSFEALNFILQKVGAVTPENISGLITGRGIYKLTDIALKEHPEIEELQSKGHKTDVGSGAFAILKDIIFFEDKPDERKEYVQVLGLANSQRVYYWIDRRYLNYPQNFKKWKVIIPQANGSGKFGEVISAPFVEKPNIGATETFLSIGYFDSESEAQATLAYIKSKFTRSMLGILKITQAMTRGKWQKVPLQDFTANSDIDWTKSISEIDQQLYVKYGLSQDEIAFIEDNVRPME